MSVRFLQQGPKIKALFGQATTGAGDGHGFEGGLGCQPDQFPRPGEEGFPGGVEPPDGGMLQPGEQDLPDGVEPPQDGQRPAMPVGFAPGEGGRVTGVSAAAT